MFYIHQINCISPQQTFEAAAIEILHLPVNGKLNVIEPAYEHIPKNMLRRMGKTVRMTVAAALAVIKESALINGIIIGSGSAGMEDSIIFLKQIVEFNEGMLTPGHFVQSTANAPAAQLSLLSSNKGYNITHVHRGLAFEMAALDAAMLLKENGGYRYLLAAVDEIATYNYQLDYLNKWYRKEEVTGSDFYDGNIPGAIAGEAAVVLLVDNEKKDAIAKLSGIATLHSNDLTIVQKQLCVFLKEHNAENIDLLISGENGDARFNSFYSGVENLLKADVDIARFKHMCGEYPSATSFAVWLACKIFTGTALPAHAIKKQSFPKDYNTVLIYNCYQGIQHSFMLLSKAG
ncbi:MAG: beta-ketoacyl synthase chain length factor [Ferruginibacter sp.]